jgi:F-type H+-transporting ATPase subunit b
MSRAIDWSNDRSKTMSRLIVPLAVALALGLSSLNPALAAPAEKEGDAHHGPHIGEAGVSNEAKSPVGVGPEMLDLGIYTGIVFMIVLIVLWRFAWGPISRALDDRERHVADNIAAAERQNQEARRLLGEYQKRLEAAQGEVREVMEEARRDARHTQDEILAKAREEAQRERDRAIRDIDLATQAALKELGEKSVNLAVQLAGKIVATNLSPDDHARMVQDAVARFAKEPSRN